MAYPILFSPIKVGSVVLKNRIIMPAMHMGFCCDGLVGDRWKNFYWERARGGVGTVVVGACDVARHGGSGKSMRLDEDRFIPAMKELASGIKELGATAMVQLYHMGRSNKPEWIGGEHPVSCSAVASPWSKVVPRELGLSEVYEIVEAFAEASRRARESGFDGVEYHGAAGYLIAQFFSPLVNKRTDEFGGSFENRARFALEIVRQTRKKTGSDFLLSMRISGNEFMPGGQGIEEACALASELEKAGLDMINVTSGFNESPLPMINMVIPRGGYAYLAGEVKKKVGLPVAASVRINTPEKAEQILSEGMADLVCMGRPLLADPYLPAKAQRGDREDIRTCVACNQGCMEESLKFRDSTCLLNPQVGHEGEYALAPASRKKRVMVVGGGPGGMEAALICAERGHRVTLHERSGRLGGQVNLACIPPGRGEFREVVSYLAGQLPKKRVEIKLCSEVTEELVSKEKPNAVILATGADPVTPPLPGFRDSRVVTYADILEGRCFPGKRIIIIGGGATGCEVAHFLARQGTLNSEQVDFMTRWRLEAWEVLEKLLWQGGKEITLVEMEKGVGANIGVTSKGIILGELKRHGVKILVKNKAVGLEPEGLRVQREGHEDVIPCDTVVMALGMKSRNGMADSLKEKVGEVHIIGDAKTPRTILEAIHEGFHVGRQL